MLEISQIRLPYGSGTDGIARQIRKILRLKDGKDLPFRIRKHSIDARRHPDILDVYTVNVDLCDENLERKIADKNRTRNVRFVKPAVYSFPAGCGAYMGKRPRPVVVGFGPAGIFAALALSSAGLRPIVLERGEAMDDRIRSVQGFWEGGGLNTRSNVQFGEGGAGTFSDGKLTTGVRDPSGRNAFVLDTFIEAGAPPEIAFEQYPHIGTDRLRSVVVNLRERLISGGGEIRFLSEMTDIETDASGITGVRVACGPGRENCFLETDTVILACGHSARDTFRMLKDRGIVMTEKSFAVGFRVTHPQEMIDERHYGRALREGGGIKFPASSYKLTHQASSGRGVYSFCMCPGGYIVNASSEEGRLAVNGMSDYGRDSGRANSAIVLTVGPETFGDGGVFQGLRFQEELEAKAYSAGAGKIPVESYEGFEESVLCGRPAESSPIDEHERERLCIKGAAAYAPLHGLFPADMNRDFIEAMREFDARYPGFAGRDAYLAGVESRTSSPVRIVRGENCMSTVSGLYPCGEGAGYAGGIMSASIDGLKVAEEVVKRYND